MNPPHSAPAVLHRAAPDARFGAHGMAFLWVVASIPIAHQLVPLDAGLFPAGPPVLGLTLGAWVERTLLWGIGPLLAYGRTRLAIIAMAAVTIGVVMGSSRAAPLAATIGREGVGVMMVLLPSQIFVRWTLERRRLGSRTALHFMLTVCLLIGLIPAILIDLTGSAISTLTLSIAWPQRFLMEALLVPLVLAVSAVTEFVTYGRGTPMPSDPPRRLVTTGPYAYVANPMQIAKVVAPVLIAFVLGRPIVAVVGVFMLAWGVAISYRAEEEQLERRFGHRWHRYRRHVPRWWPRWRPWRDPDQLPARMYIDAACPTCARLGRWFTGIAGLEVHATADHAPPIPGRISYDPQDGGPEVHGVRAVARGLEHRHFGWALWGWSARLPGVRWLADAAADMVLGGPRPPVVPQCNCSDAGEHR